MSTDRPTFQQAVAALGGRELDVLEKLIAKAPFGIYVDDPTEGCIFASDALLDQFGISWEEFRGFGWARFILPEDAERMEAAIAEYESKLGTIIVSYRVQGDPEPRWVHARVTAIVDEAGNHIGSVGLTFDVTEERAAKDRSLQAQKLEAIGQLSARLAHDFNNLLTAMTMGVELIREEVDSPQGSETLATLNLALEQAGQLTGQLLTLAREKARRGTNVAVLDDEVRGLCNLLTASLGEGIAIELELDAADCYVPLDAGQLGQLVINLATNARDAMAGKGTLTLRTEIIRTEAGDERVLLAVADTGTGMDRATLEQATEPFFSGKERGRGSGLGLTTVQDLVELAGGRLGLASELGSGTTATVELPRVGANLYVEELAPAQRDHSRASGRVLLVEDNDAVRQSVGYALAMAGYTVEAAATLDQAHALVNTEEPFDILVSDVMLPDGTGVELAHELRAAAPKLPVVLMSGFSGDAGEEIAAAGALTTFVPKPFKPHDVLDAIVRVRAAEPA